MPIHEGAAADVVHVGVTVGVATRNRSDVLVRMIAGDLGQHHHRLISAPGVATAWE